MNLPPQVIRDMKISCRPVMMKSKEEFSTYTRMGKLLQNTETAQEFKDAC